MALGWKRDTDAGLTRTIRLTDGEWTRRQLLARGLTDATILSESYSVFAKLNDARGKAMVSMAVAFFAVPAGEVYQKVILYLWALIAGSEALAMSIWLIVAAFSDRNGMTELTVMPLFLLPGFITPLMIWSQLTIAGRLWDGRTS